MKKILFLITFFFIFFTNDTLPAKIIETAHFNEIKNYIKPNTLVLLDIDDTLLILKHTLGTDAWFLYQKNKYKQAGMDEKAALYQALNDWEGIRHFADIEIVEAGSDKIIADMQNENVKILGLTTQGLTLSSCTKRQLLQLNINLAKTSPSKEDFYFVENGRGVLYHDGILFTSGTQKGISLFKWLDHIHYRPERIVFINDKATHIEDVEKIAAERGVEFIGLRYGYADKRIAAYNMELAEIQWTASSFAKIISDKEAHKTHILKKNVF